MPAARPGPNEAVLAAVLSALAGARIGDRVAAVGAGSRTTTALLGPAWEALQSEEPEVAALFDDERELADWLTSARALVDAYFSLEDPRRREPAAREQLVEWLMPGGLRLRGIVDRLDVAPTGDVMITDYKTGRAPGEMFEAKALFQMKFYGLVLWRTRGVVPRLLQLLYLGDEEVLRYAPDEADLLAVERKLRALWEAVERATQARDFRPRPSRLCDWCSHQALCPAFGGTPPPWPERVPGPDELLPHQVRAAERSTAPA